MDENIAYQLTSRKPVLTLDSSEPPTGGETRLTIPEIRHRLFDVGKSGRHNRDSHTDICRSSDNEALIAGL
jgi:hypothetical protein